MNRRVYLIAGALLIVILMWVGLSRKKDRPDSPQAQAASTKEVLPQPLYDQGVELEKEGEMIQAKQVYQKVIGDHPDFEQVEEIQKRLEKLNMRILFSNVPTEETTIHKVESGDTLGKLAKKYRTTIELIKISNHLSSNIIRVGQNLRIWTGTFNILVDKSQNILILKDEDEVMKVYTVSTGENNSTPIGNFTIVEKLVNPVWFNRGAVVPPESPANVLGSRWLGFDLAGYGIHGTTEPETIGTQETAGCIRMKNEDVEELFSILPRGVKVTIVN